VQSGSRPYTARQKKGATKTAAPERFLLLFLC
jgi:hypothetical protein